MWVMNVGGVLATLLPHVVQMSLKRSSAERRKHITSAAVEHTRSVFERSRATVFGHYASKQDVPGGGMLDTLLFLTCHMMDTGTRGGV